jgi:hypothetical protein
MSAYKLINCTETLHVGRTLQHSMMLPEIVSIQIDVLSTLLQYQVEGSVSLQLYHIQQLWLLIPRPRNSL